MKANIKHKFLGILVIISLVVLVLPLFQHRNNMIVDASLTNSPPFPDQSVQVIAQDRADHDVDAPQAVATEVQFNQDKQPEKNIPQSSWIIQVGSFKNKTNALKLVNQLRAKGFQARLGNTGARITRVLVGPAKEKDDAHALAARLEADLKIKPIIVRYDPLTS